MPLDLAQYDEKAVYMFYNMFDTTVKSLELKEKLTEEESTKLVDAKAFLAKIEVYTLAKRAEGLRWSLTSLFKEKNMDPTLILEFYPGSEAYSKFGKNVVANIEYSDDDLKLITENIRKGDQALRISSQLKFKKVPEFTDEEISTGDIFIIQ